MRSTSCSLRLLLSMSSWMLLGVGGGFGVGAREPHGDRLERKPCRLSGADILSTTGAFPPARRGPSQDWGRCCGVCATRGGRRRTRRAGVETDVVGGLEGETAMFARALNLTETCDDAQGWAQVSVVHVSLAVQQRHDRWSRYITARGPLAASLRGSPVALASSAAARHRPEACQRAATLSTRVCVFAAAGQTMASHCTRSSSIPRQYHRIAREERFSVTEAVHLKLKLQALDNALSSTNLRDHGTVDMKRITDACQSRPFHETVYVDGSEEFYLLVKGISRPDLVPNVYIDAYKAVLQRRPHVNEYRVSDFTKGVDPTFSEIRVLLGRIDDLCETDLEGAFNRLDDRGKHQTPSISHNPLTGLRSQTVSLSPATCRTPSPSICGAPAPRTSPCPHLPAALGPQTPTHTPRHIEAK